MSNNNIVRARTRLKMTSGDAVRAMRDLQEMTQGELAAACGVPQPAISSIESGRSSLGADRAEKLARAFHVHPAVLLWPNWEPESADAKEARTHRVVRKLDIKPVKKIVASSRVAAK